MCPCNRIILMSTQYICRFTSIYLNNNPETWGLRWKISQLETMCINIYVYRLKIPFLYMYIQIHTHKHRYIMTKKEKTISTGNQFWKRYTAECYSSYPWVRGLMVNVLFPLYCLLFSYIENFAMSIYYIYNQE